MLGIDEAEFLKATNGTFKLGIEFIDWGRKGESYIHPFGTHGVDMQGIDFHQYWLHSKKGGNPTRLQDYSLCAVAAAHEKFMLPDNNPRSILSHMRYAYHIDATRYAKYLRGYAEKRGVTRKEGIVEDVLQKANSGDISSLKMNDGTVVEGDFFFDCTGFRALLTEKTLDVPFKDWSHWLPCDTAQTVPTERVGSLLPYTKATAKTAGWQWRIPTQHRTGNGHIYSSKYMKDEEALDILMDGLDSQPLGEPRKIKFKTGCREKLWNKNCIAVGLSGISRFITLFPTADVSDVVRDEYNKQMQKEFDQVRDFIILHYCATERNDSPFWNYCRTSYDDELFSKPSWIAVCLGQNIFPEEYDPIVAGLPLEQVHHSLSSMREAMQRAAINMPSHADFLQQYGATI